ncbi:MAG TPA: YIP1 family protein [Pyrinomonadaceae bacterium]|nr:YIP1 family protein [Pyrinomonadaceae bacterium]
MSETNSPTTFSTPAAREAEQMSTPQTLSNIFFEPARTFEALRERPRFLVATLITALLVVAFTFVMFQRVSYEAMIRESIETNSRTADMSAEQKEQMIEMQTKPVVKAIGYVAPLVFIFIILAAGAGIYLLGAMLMGKGMSYRQALSVWAYSTFPPTLLLMLANIIMLLVAPPDPAEAAQNRGSLIHANLSLLVNGTERPVLATLLGSFDVFIFFGLFLAATGLHKVARLSKGAAWGIVIAIWVLGVILKLAFATFSGSPIA